MGETATYFNFKHIVVRFNKKSPENIKTQRIHKNPRKSSQDILKIHINIDREKSDKLWKRPNRFIETWGKQIIKKENLENFYICG